MPAISSLILTDGTTPVTLSPRDHVSGATSYRATTSLVASQNMTVRYTYRDTANKVNRCSVVAKQPLVTEGSPGVYTSRGEITCEINLMVPPGTTQAERLQFVLRVFDVINTGQLRTELTTGEGQW